MAFGFSWRRCRWCRDIVRDTLAAEGHRATAIRSASDSSYVVELEAQYCVSRYSGLQGSYNAYSDKRGFRVPHGDVVVFALS